MNVAKRLFFIAAALALSGCEAVFTQQPLGDETVALDPATWQGTWLSGEVVIVTTVLDSQKGQLQAAWMERKNSGAELESVTGSVRRSGGILYLNMVHEPIEQVGSGETSAQKNGVNHRQKPEYFWARIENDGQRAILWWPDVEQFRLAVSDSRLPGMIKEDKDVVLGPLEATQLELINKPASNLLEWSRPLAFIRIGD